MVALLVLRRTNQRRVQRQPRHTSNNYEIVLSFFVNRIEINVALVARLYRNGVLGPHVCLNTVNLARFWHDDAILRMVSAAERRVHSKIIIKIESVRMLIVCGGQILIQNTFIVINVCFWLFFCLVHGSMLPVQRKHFFSSISFKSNVLLCL